MIDACSLHLDVQPEGPLRTLRNVEECAMMEGSCCREKPEGFLVQHSIHFYLPPPQRPEAGWAMPTGSPLMFTLSFSGPWSI